MFEVWKEEMILLCAFLAGCASLVAILLLEQYVLLTREPVVVRCDAGTELLEDYPIPDCFEAWIQNNLK